MTTKQIHMQFEFLDCYHYLFSPSMARKSSKCSPAVESSQTGCVWNFGGVFDHHHHHHHGGSHRKLLSDESHRSTSLPGAGNEGNQMRMLTFDEQLRNINMQSKKNKKEEFWKKTMEKYFWKNIKSRYQIGDKKKENTNIIDRIVVLKPIEGVVECPIDIGCQCLHLHPHQNYTSKQHIVEHTHVSFNDVRKNVKSSKKFKSFRKMKSCSESDETGSKTENLSLVPYSNHQEPEVFVEAKRHLAERLRLVAMGMGGHVGELSGSSCKQVSRTLERILLSSPIHESMAAFEHEQEKTHGERSLHTMWSGSSPLKQNECSSASRSVEITDTSEFLSHYSMFSDMDSDPNNSGPSPSGTDGCMELLLNVASPKAGCKSENMDSDQLRENPSPVSVLDSFFSDNVNSPTSTTESAEHHIRPRRLDFEEQSSQTSSPQRITSLSLYVVDQGFISSFVNEIYQTAQSNWEHFLATDHPLESSCDDKILYDCVKEVLVSLHSRITLFNVGVQPFSLERDVIDKVVDQVNWHNGQPIGPPTLDHIFRRDIAKCGPWLDTSSDRDDIVVEVADKILQELVIEATHDMYI